jgi:glucuronate isomerase
LPKTVLYTINSTKNEVLGTLVGAFSSSIPGKIQFGTAWWFNDHINGMKNQMKSLAELGALGRFIGMLTDSRSFLSYTRHEYFRRILCDLVGGWIDNGELHDDIEFYGKLVKGICFNNAAEYFPIEFK